MLSTASSTSYSAEKLDLRTATLATGEKAPFAGRLLTADALSKIITDLEARVATAEAARDKAMREREILVRREKLICEIKVDGEQQKRSLCITGCDKKMELVEAALDRCHSDKRGFFQSPYFNFVMGNVVAGGLCAAASAMSR